MLVLAAAGAAWAGPGQGPADRDVHVEVAAARFGLSPSLVAEVIRVESGGDPRAVSSKGAMGLMQLMPATWRMLRARLDLGDDPFDPRDNILAGAAYLRDLHDRYGAPGFLAAYNAGPGRYEASLLGRPLPAETQAYLARLSRTTPTRSPTPGASSWAPSALFAPRLSADPEDGGHLGLADRAEQATPSPALAPAAGSLGGLNRPSGVGLFAPRSRVTERP